jgi:hypothetical protein
MFRDSWLLDKKTYKGRKLRMKKKGVFVGLPPRSSPSQKFFMYFREAPTGADRRGYKKYVELLIFTM